MFFKKHTKAIIDNIDQVKKCIGYYKNSDTILERNDIVMSMLYQQEKRLIGKIDKIINSNLYDDYHHIAYQRFTDSDDSDNLQCPNQLIYQATVYCQLRIELLNLLDRFVLNMR